MSVQAFVVVDPYMFGIREPDPCNQYYALCKAG